ncbi:MAG: type II secretion system protein [Candidatus Spyradenecus sp.]
MFSLRRPHAVPASERRRAKAGFTLIELTAASAILILLSLFMLDSIMTYRRVSEENKCRLLADAYAWDLLWKQFNRPFDHLPQATPTDDLLVTLPAAEAKRDLPALSHNGETPIRRYLRIRREGNYCTLVANVYWQVGGKWRSLWQADPTDPNGDRSPYRLVRTNNSRLTD